MVSALAHLEPVRDNQAFATDAESTPILVAGARPPDAKGGEISKPVRWDSLLREQVMPAVKTFAPAFEDDFQSFWGARSKNPQDKKAMEKVRANFMKARFLYELFREGGIWGYRYVYDANDKTWQWPRESIAMLSRNAEKEGGDKESVLFTADCDEVSFLFAQTAELVGLKGVSVRLVFDTHVNVFVPLGEGIVLRMDPTGISQSEEQSWNLPKNEYTASGNPADPASQAGYKRITLDPLNRKLAPHAAVLGKMGLSPKSAQVLLERIRRAHPQARRESVPSEWRDFLSGYRHARGCYQRYLVPVSGHTVEEAAAIARSDGGALRIEAAERDFLECVEKADAQGRVGALYGYLYWAQCRPAPRHDESQFVSCWKVFTSFRSSFDRDAENCRVGDHAHPIDHHRLDGPTTSSLSEWVEWLAQQEGKPAAELYARLAHLAEKHPEFFSEK